MCFISLVGRLLANCILDGALSSCLLMTGQGILCIPEGYCAAYNHSLASLSGSTGLQTCCLWSWCVNKGIKIALKINYTMINVEVRVFWTDSPHCVSASCRVISSLDCVASVGVWEWGESKQWLSWSPVNPPKSTSGTEFVGMSFVVSPRCHNLNEGHDN